MGKTLIIAEKPSVAKDIAAVLSVSRSGEYYENNEFIISNCIGHLVEINVPESESRNAPHPIIPEVFGLKEIPDTKKQFKLIKSLMHRSDVSCVVNACDAGREGELIFRLSYELAGCNKPMQRMWLQSMTKAGIKGAWDGRKPGKDFDNLADAAKSRSEADWLVGINASRTYRTAIGRVMTPTLALVVNRFIVNRDFVPTDYYEVMATIGLQAGDFDAKWQPVGALAGKPVENIAIAEAVVAKCKGKTPSSVSDESKPQKKAPPFLFDLTSLQREANKRFRMSAQKTLNIAQALYEKHKATSYPRTDSQRLPEDYVGKCVSVLSALSKSRPLAQKPVDNQWVRPNKRIFDDSKISDHFAIIPTGVIPDGLSGDEKKVYDLIVDRFISIFYPDAEYMTTVRTTVIEGEIFRATGSVLLKEGWLEVVGKSALDGDSKDAVLPVINPSETPVNRKVALAACRT
jgi:DNA topoisomerase-3